MRRMLLTLGLATTSAIAILAACVGDDPTPSVTSSSTSSGGSSGGSSSGASSSGASSSGASSSGASSSSGGSSSGDAGDASPGYDVRSLKGLKLWLESTKELVAGSSGGAPFGKWSDQSGAWDASADGAPDGGRHVAEPEGVNPPTIVMNAINGRPTVSFTDTNGFVHIANHEDFHFGLGDFLIVEVAKVASGDGPLWKVKPSQSTGNEELLEPGRVCVAYATASPTTECTAPVYAPPAGAHVFVARRKGDLFTLRADGTVQGSLDRATNPPDFNIPPFKAPYVFIGGGLTMQVSELIVVVGPTSDADLTTLEGHLKTKYAIP